MLTLPGPFLVDFYKWGHAGMIRPETRVIYSNITARGYKYFQHLPDFDGKVLIVGQRRAIDDVFAHWNEEFFQKDKETVISHLRDELRLALPSNARIDECLAHFEDLHDLGYLPVRIDTVPEGTRLPIKIPFMTIRNTDERFAFITNFLETVISAEIWKTIVNASTAFEFLTHLTRDALVTVSPNRDDVAAAVRVQSHDFSMRGMSGVNDAMNSGIGHLTCFLGTDTFAAIPVVRHHYDVPKDQVVGCSVPATEHMVMCLDGKDGEIETFRRLIEDDFPTGIISIVSDTWDFFKVITEYIPKLKDVIMNRTPDSTGLARVVLRPDSGDPVLILCGDPSYPPGSPEYKGAVECLWDTFGGTITKQGFKLLDTHIGLIYGDAINLTRSIEISNRLRAKGFSALPVIRGIGSFTYQYVTRDTFSIAVKATAAVVGDEIRYLLKDPKTDDGTKKSASGFLKVLAKPAYPVLGDGAVTYQLVENLTLEESETPDVYDLLTTMVVDNQFAEKPKWNTILDRVGMALDQRLSQ